MNHTIQNGHTDTVLSEELIQLQQESAIDPDVMQERGYRWVTTKKEVQELEYRLMDYQIRVPALMFPVYRLGDPTPYAWVIRPETPRTGTDGKPIKYDWLAGVPPCLDILPSYRDALQNPAIPAWITEGAKKADALASAFGYSILPISLNGVWGWRKRDATGVSTPLDDFAGIAWKGRSVVLAFDSDVIRKKAVQDALRALAKELQGRAANVRALLLPDYEPAKGVRA